MPHITFNKAEDADTFAVFFISEMVRRNVQWTRIVNIIEKLISSKRNERALHCCCKVMLQTNSPNTLDCLKFLNEKEPLRPHYFWPLFLSHYHSNGETGILNVLQEMNNLKVPVDHDTLIHYVLTKLPITMKDAQNGIRILSDKGITIGLLFTPVLYHLIQQFKIDEALAILNLHKTKVDSDMLLWPLIMNVRNFKKNSPTPVFAELVHTINARSEKSSLAGKILVDIIGDLEASVLVTIMEQFYAVGLKIPTKTCDEMVDHVNTYFPKDIRNKAAALLRKMLDNTLDDTITANYGQVKHPRDMSLEELESHLIELQSKKMNTRGECINIQFRSSSQICPRILK